MNSDFYYEANFSLHETVACQFVYLGDLDGKGRFEGQATLKIVAAEAIQ